MLKWIKIESELTNDSRIQTLLERFGYCGLGIYLSMRIAIEAINAKGVPLTGIMTICQPKASRKTILSIIYEFDLFHISEKGLVTVAPIACTDARTDARTDTHTDTLGPYDNSKLEENRREEKKKRACFRKPSLDEVSSYCQQRQNNIDPQEFIDFYESKGWMVGSNHMKDWQAAIRTWERKRQNSPNPSKRYLEVPDLLDQRSGLETNPDLDCQPIPENAPPKPSPTAQWNYATDSWSEFY